MKRLAQALRKGFSAAREDRLHEWTEIRRQGFLRHWFRRNPLLIVMLATVVVLQNLRMEDPSWSQVGAGIAFMVFMALVFLGVDYLGWRRSEEEWSAWRKEMENTDA